MHELGIVTHVADTLEDVAKENNLKKIGSSHPWRSEKYPES